MRSGIYLIRNTATGRVYVGQSRNVGVRWGLHLGALRRGTHDNRYLQSSFSKHHEAAFAFIFLEAVPTHFLTTYEETYLSYYRSLPGGVYNSAGPVDSPWLGRKHSAETRKRIGDAHRGKRLSELTKDRLRAAAAQRGGRPHSEETKRKIAASNKGKRLGRTMSTGSAAAFSRFREASKKAVVQCDPETNAEVAVFDSISQAAAAVNGLASSISRCCMLQWGEQPPQRICLAIR